MKSPVADASKSRLVGPVAAAKFPPSRYAVRLNPNGERNYAVGESLYPGIVTIKKATGQIAAIAAVETEDSLTQARAASWRDCAALGYPFYLFVPALAYTAARDLLLRLRIAVSRVIVYRCKNDIVELV